MFILVTNIVYKNYFAFKHIRCYSLEEKLVVIQKREYQINGVSYYQYRLNIPSKIINSLRWNELDKIEFTIIDGNLVCKNVIKLDKSKKKE